MSAMHPSGSTFPPLGNEYVVGVASATLLTREEAVRIGSLVDGGAIDDALARQLGAALVVAVETANSQYFRFDLRFLDEVTSQSLIAVDTTIAVAGLDQVHQTRKVTIVLPLVAVDAATIRFPMVDRQVTLVPGTATMFPAYLHAVLEPAGAFTGIVVHAQGPVFR